MKVENEKKEEGRYVPIRVEVPPDLRTYHVNYAFVAHTDDEFFITFGLMHQPYLVEPTKEQIQAIEYVPAKAVSRIALSPRKMKEVIDVLNTNYQLFLKKRAGEGKP